MAKVMSYFLSLLLLPLFAQSSSHSHAFHDIRFALIEVVSFEGATLYFADIEAQEVGPDHRIEIGPSFGLFEVQVDKGRWVLKEMKRKVRKGDFGVLSYCDFCRAGISLRLLQGPHRTVVSVGPRGMPDIR